MGKINLEESGTVYQSIYRLLILGWTVMAKTIDFYLCSIAALTALSACSSSREAKLVATGLPMVMDLDKQVELQRPALPVSEFLAWTPEDRLYHSVTIDYIEGLSHNSYLFSKPNQRLFRPMLTSALDSAGLLAYSPVEARYALQVEFKDVKANAIGFNFAGKSHAVYRIVSRYTGQTVFQTDVDANFIVFYPQLNEDDLEDAYKISRPGVVNSAKELAYFAAGEGGVVEAINNNEPLTDFFGGPIDELSQSSWNDVTQSFVWAAGVSAIAGPLEIVRRHVNPMNYLAIANLNDVAPNAALRANREGALGESGVGSRNGLERAQQANAQMLEQSIVKFAMDLAQDEHIRMNLLLPCTSNTEVELLKVELMKANVGYRTNACDSTRMNQRAPGLGYTTLH